MLKKTIKKALVRLVVWSGIIVATLIVIFGSMAAIITTLLITAANFFVISSLNWMKKKRLNGGGKVAEIITAGKYAEGFLALGILTLLAVATIVINFYFPIIPTT